MKIALFLLSQGLFVLALTVKSARIRRLFFPFIAVINLFLTFSPIKTGLPFLIDYLLTCGQLSNLIIISDYLLLTDVQKELHLTGQVNTASTLPFPARIEWAIRLLCSPRGIGWTHEPKVLPSRSREYRRVGNTKKFAIDQILRLSLYAVLYGLVSAYTQHLLPSTLYFPTPFSQLLDALLWATPVILFLDGTHRIFSIAFLYSSTVGAEDWIPLFGSWREAYTIRRFWGRTWHQMLRRFTLSQGAFIAERMLGLDKKTDAYFVVQVITAFSTSAAIHATADLVWIGEWHGAFYFFLAQALAVIAESMIARKVPVNLVNSAVGRYFGYLWVLSWFTLSTPLWHITFIGNDR